MGLPLPFLELFGECFRFIGRRLNVGRMDVVPCDNIGNVRLLLELAELLNKRRAIGLLYRLCEVFEEDYC